jgi:hypothetical protein
MNTKLILVGAMGMLALGIAGNVRGQDGVYGSPCVLACGNYLGPTTYCSEPAPYFALHPPVYYSYRVARTYGYSPFAYPPGVLTPGSERPHAIVVQNANVRGPDDGPESQEGPQPLRIDNPFVDQPREPGATGGQSAANRRPQVVYPVAMARRHSQSLGK